MSFFPRAWQYNTPLDRQKQDISLADIRPPVVGVALVQLLERCPDRQPDRIPHVGHHLLEIDAVVLRCPVITEDVFPSVLNLVQVLAESVAKSLRGAALRGANLRFTKLLETDFRKTDLTGSLIFGAATWKLKLEGARHQDLVITEFNEPPITVDDIEIAQFIYLMLNNQKIRNVIDTVTSKSVLILGRFTKKRKVVLDALREELRKRNYLPILFDFKVPVRQNFTETITLLARMARFIIADLTDPSSIAQELQAIIPSVRVPVQPVLLKGSSLYSMFKDFDPRDFHWVLPVYEYEKPKQLLATLAENVIERCSGPQPS